MNEITLSKLQTGKKAIVSKINGGHQLLKKLNSLGIYEGVEIKKITSYFHGPVIVEVMSSKVAIGRGMSEKILVKEIN